MHHSIRNAWRHLFNPFVKPSLGTDMVDRQTGRVVLRMSERPFDKQQPTVRYFHIASGSAPTYTISGQTVKQSIILDEISGEQTRPR